MLNTAYQTRPQGSDHIYRFVLRPGILIGKVLEAEYSVANQYQEIVLSAQYFQEQNKLYSSKGKVLLRVYGDETSWQYGDLLKAIVRLQEPSLPNNFGEFNYREYLVRQKIFVTASIAIDQVELIGRSKQFGWRYFVNYVKNKIEQNINAIYHYPHSALIKAILIGDRTDIPSEWELIFQDAGIMHILAISGLHIGIITATLFFLFNLLPFFRRKKGLSCIIMISLLLGYAALTGFRPPVTRAVFMFITLLIAGYINRPYHLYNSLYFAALMLLLYQPLLLFDAGFLLSFMATFFIIFLYPLIEKKLIVLPSYISKPLAVSLSAWLGIAPLSAYYFYKISYLAPLSNLLIVPLMSIILILGLLSLICSLVFLPWGAPLALVNELFINLIIFISRFFSSLPFAYRYLAQPRPYQMLYYYFFLILIACTLYVWVNLDIYQKRRIFWMMTASLAIFLFIELLFSYPMLSVHFLNVGQGDSILIQTPYQQNILIDGGGTPFSDFDLGKKVILPYLRRLGVNGIDLMVLSHPDLDHIEGLLPVLREMKVNMVIDSGINAPHIQYLEYLSLIKDNPEIAYYQAQPGDIIRLTPDLEIIILNSLNSLKYSQESNFNNHSIVLKLLYKNTSFLFTGDIEERVELELLSRGDLLRSDILKVAHHGSITSSSMAFLEKVRPEVAVISVGVNNFDHPHQDVMDRLASICQKVLRTDVQGTILVKSDGQKYYINTLR